jgi:type II restriction/modification system DNA methylase subunit YeeA
METSKLKKFAQFARRSLVEQVASKLTQVLKAESPSRRELPTVVAKLEEELKSKGKEQVIEKVAYTWFNRFCALRFMDANQYNRIMVLSPIAGQFQPEILAEAKAGHIDESVVSEATREKIFGLLDGSIKSRDSQSEAYRLLIVAVCNDYHRIMPYLFERIEDFTELLMPDDLLSGNSILAYTREAMTPEACESVECIGWLYQFYISEKKDKVFEGLKNNKKITPENIPAATQLFTPHWIVRYLVENSLGRLWMLNNPNSKVIEQMDYYIKPIEEEKDFLKINTPEEIKICDPACGSGHMLTYSYDLLYAIYLDAGYDPVDIPELILSKNLYGIEIDERAAELAGFALSMKAIKGNPNDESNNRRRFFRNPIKPNICRLENVSFKEDELDEYIAFVGRDLFTQELRATLKEFEEADNFGSLIRPSLNNAEQVLAILESKDVSGQLFLSETHDSVLRVIKQVDYLSQKYHVVVANPPYMGRKGMNKKLGEFVKVAYPESKSDLFAMFIERSLRLTLKCGSMAMINMQSWMFLSSFEKLRSNLLAKSTILTMAHIGERGFDTIGGAVVSTTAFVLANDYWPSVSGDYVRLVDGSSEREKDDMLLASICDANSELRFKLPSSIFDEIPGNLITYWLNPDLVKVFSIAAPLSEYVRGIQGIITGDNDAFLRYWPEVSRSTSLVPPDVFNAEKCNDQYWVPYTKGGEYRRWYGNGEYLVFWRDEGRQLTRRRSENSDLYFQECVSWNKISTRNFAARYLPVGYVWDVAGSSIFPQSHSDTLFYTGLMGSVVAQHILSSISPTLNFEMETILGFPLIRNAFNQTLQIGELVKSIIDISSTDWDASETSWDFTTLPVLQSDNRAETLECTYTNLRTHWQSITDKMQMLEEENNRIFIGAYGLQDELTPEVPLNEITLTCNPAYSIKGDKTNEEREIHLRKRTIEEFLSYAVGCMFGRYSLDAPGLILANQGETLADYLARVPELSFMPDEDNVIPMIDFEGDWFEDDISERFKQFLKVTFGEDNFAENLTFVEEALGKDIKKYFAKDFYADHVKRYKKRPIYWLFSSPKGTFNTLIYMHRYRPDTVSIVLNDYLREFRTKLQARKESYEQIEISASASPKDKTQAIKAIGKINMVLEEVNDYERDILYPLAGQNIEIDLDDGVKHNYPLFGKALKKVTGLS